MIWGGIFKNRGMGSFSGVAGFGSGGGVLVRFHIPSMAGARRLRFAAIVICTPFFVELRP
jgi:hypothetical protein